MNALFSLLAPLLLILGLGAAGRGDLDAWQALTDGAEGGIRLMRELFPTLLLLFPALSLLRASGFPEFLQRCLSPVLDCLGVPEETVLLLLLRPLSGSAALAEAARLIRAHGADSLVGRTAAVMLGSSETSFYVVAVYFTAARVKRSRWAIPAAVGADLVCFLSASWICRLLWG